MMVLYSFALGFGLLVSSPWWVFRTVTTSRYREGLQERLGRVPGRVREAVAGRQVVWLHAVSVGEVLAAVPLAEALEEALRAIPGPGGWVVVVSTTTRTGQALARERFGKGRVFWFPLDFAWAVRAWMRVLRPRLIVLLESEIWPRLLHECRRRGLPVVVVNARMSDRSFRRARRVRRLWGPVLRRVTLFLAQSEETAERLRALGAGADRVRVTGNLKYDVRAPQPSRVAELVRAAAGERPVVVAGSTVGRLADVRESEEEMLLAAWEGAPRQKWEALLVLAPRHPERFAEVYAAARKFPARRASEMLAAERRDPDFPASGAGSADAAGAGSAEELVEVVVLDTIGDLAAVYRLADVAFVGGSLVRRGGHNPLEPARFGVPVVMGPSVENFREIVAEMQKADGIEIVRDADELAPSLERLLKDRVEADLLGQRGMKVFARKQGATERTVAALVQVLRQAERSGSDGAASEAGA